MNDTARDRLAAHLENQATACDRMGSPFTANACRALGFALDRSTATGRRALDWPRDMAADALALRLCGGLHALVLSRLDAELAEAYPPARVGIAELTKTLQAAIPRHDERLAKGLDSPPQTNEIARAAMLLPGLLAIARETSLPLAINEIGSSAGLNLLLDRFAYRYAAAHWGAPSSAVQLAPETRGAEIPLNGDLIVLRREASDISPIDIARDDHRLRLRSYVWADQTARIQRLDAALALAQAEPLDMRQADAADYVRSALAGRRDEETFVLMHSIMWQYMPAATRNDISGAMDKAGANATARSPLAWLRMEPIAPTDPHAALLLTLWPRGETRHLANCDYHGRWIEWLAPVSNR